MVSKALMHAKAERDKMTVCHEDLLIGAEAIANFLGLKRRQIYSAVDRGDLPCFRIGALVCARRSVIINWITEQETTNNPTARKSYRNL